MKLRQTQIKKIQSILKKHDVKRADLFGSYARGDADKNSDIDILFQFKGRKSLFDHSGLKIDLEKNLKKDVDVITYRSVNHRLKPYIMENLVSIFGATSLMTQ